MRTLADRARAVLLEHQREPDHKELCYAAAFTALGMANLDWKRGVSHFSRILEKMGSGYYTSKRTLLQPPLFGFLLAGFYEMAPDEDSAVTFLNEVFNQVLDFHRHLYENRDPEDSGLLIITHEAEDLLWSAVGSDAGPSDLYRQDPLFNALLAWSNECLIDIGALLGEEITEILLWNELTVYTLNEKLWWEATATYRACHLPQETLIPLGGLLPLMPLIGGIPDQDQAEGMLENLQEGAFNYLLAPLPPEEEYNFPAGTRVSIIANWLLYHGLWRFGMSAAAGKVRQFSLALMERYGFREEYELGQYPPEFDPLAPAYLPVAGLCLAWLEDL